MFRSAPIGSRIANDLIQNGTSKHVSRIIWFRTGLQSAFRKSFDSEWEFIVHFTNHFIDTGDKKLFSRGRDAHTIIWYLLGMGHDFRIFEYSI